jgi:hypothetical protein
MIPLLRLGATHEVVAFPFGETGEFKDTTFMGWVAPVLRPLMIECRRGFANEMGSPGDGTGSDQARIRPASLNLPVARAKTTSARLGA